MTVPFISSGKPLEAVTAGPISLMTPREKVITVVAIAAIAAGVALSIVAPPLTALFVVGVVLASGGAIGVVARAVSIYCRIHRMESLLQEVTQALKDNPDKSPIKTAARALDMSPLVLAWIIKRGAPTTLAAAAEVERGSVEWVAAQLSTTVEALKVALIDVSIYKNCLAKECHKEEFNEKVTRQLIECPIRISLTFQERKVVML